MTDTHDPHLLHRRPERTCSACSVRLQKRRDNRALIFGILALVGGFALAVMVVTAYL